MRTTDWKAMAAALTIGVATAAASAGAQVPVADTQRVSERVLGTRPSMERMAEAVKRRLEAAGIMYSDAGQYAMLGYRQIYLYDPSMNLIEVNQRIS